MSKGLKFVVTGDVIGFGTEEHNFHLTQLDCVALTCDEDSRLAEFMTEKLNENIEALPEELKTKLEEHFEDIDESDIDESDVVESSYDAESEPEPDAAPENE